MKRFNVEVMVGIFLVIGFAGFSYLAVKLGDIKVFSDETYTITGAFDSVSGLKSGASIELAGVGIGKVTSIRFDPESYQAIVSMDIKKMVRLQDDSIASIRTSGIIGDKFVNISPGGSDEFLEDGSSFEDTESSVNLEELVSKYIFDK